MSAPHVAGAAALILEQNPAFSPAQVRDELLARATQGVISNVPSGTTRSLLYTLADEVPNVPPTATSTFSCTGLDCTFDGRGSNDPDGTIEGYLWSLPDGTQSTEPQPALFFPGYVAQSVTLQVTDNEGAAADDHAERSAR